MPRQIGVLLAIALSLTALGVALLGGGDRDPDAVPEVRAPADDRLRDLAGRISSLEERLDRAPAPGARLPEEDRRLLEEVRGLLTREVREELEEEAVAEKAESDALERYRIRLRRDAERLGTTVEELRLDFFAANSDEGDAEDRFRRMEDFVRDHPGTIYAHEVSNRLGIALRFREEYGRAEEAFRRVIRGAEKDAADEDGHPYRAVALFRLGAMLVDQGRLPEAERRLETLSEDYPDLRHPLGRNTYAGMLKATIELARRK